MSHIMQLLLRIEKELGGEIKISPGDAASLNKALCTTDTSISNFEEHAH